MIGIRTHLELRQKYDDLEFSHSLLYGRLYRMKYYFVTLLILSTLYYFGFNVIILLMVLYIILLVEIIL